MGHWFAEAAARSAYVMGHYWAFTLALLGFIVWAVSGQSFGYSDTWQLVINTATTVLTFLAVFLIQNSQNRESRAVQPKLDELIRVMDAASNRLIDIKEDTDEELERLSHVYRRIGTSSRPQARPEEDRVLTGEDSLEGLQ